MLADEPKTNIARVRKAAGISQQTLAHELNVSIKMLSMWETGQRFPRAATVAAAAERFGTSTDYLLERTGDPRPCDDLARQAADIIQPVEAALDRGEDDPPAAEPGPPRVQAPGQPRGPRKKRPTS